MIVNDISVYELNDLLNDIKSFKKSVNNSIPIQSRKTIKSLIFKSRNYGDFMVIDNLKSSSNRNIYVIKFLKTGYTMTTTIGSIREGSVKDPLMPHVYGIGYVGLDIKKILKTDRILHRNMYDRWTNMMRRCYNPNDNHYHIYGMKNIKVSKRWHNYSNYYYDVQKLPGYDRDKILAGKLTLDKDKLQTGIKNKKYSRTTCCWISYSEQNEYVDSDMAQDNRKKYFIAIYPDGHKEICKGIGKFARSHNIDHGDCSRAINGKKRIVKGYKFRLATDDEIKKYKQTK